jgi:hypothetical protein
VASPFSGRFYHAPAAHRIVPAGLAKPRELAAVFPGGQKHDIDEFSLFGYIKWFVPGIK